MTAISVILGAKLKWDAAVQPVASPALQRRVDAALQATAPDALFLVTGAAMNGLPSEASAAARMLIDAGIGPARILIEDQSRNTFENLVNVQSLLAAKGLPATNLTLISDAYHLPRARVIARLLGLRVKTLPARRPDVRLLKRAHMTLRECASIPLSAARVQLHLTRRNS